MPRVRRSRGASDSTHSVKASTVAAARRRFGKENTASLQALCKLSPEQRLTLLRSAKNSLVKSICECALNTVHGNVVLTQKEKARLSRHKQLLRKLASSKGSLKSKKQILVQSGSGFLPMLIAPVLGTLFSHLFGK